LGRRRPRFTGGSYLAETRGVGFGASLGSGFDESQRGGRHGMKWVLIGFVKLWRAVVSPWYGPVCKYYPSCSAYGLEALELHGALKGSALALWRILRCNPWSHGGVDPVPGSSLETQVAQWWHEDKAAAGKNAATDLGANRMTDFRACSPELSAAMAVMG
jgi:putative membrane protein insertion efficiency factor